MASVKAWYFGGTMKLDVFNSEMYIKLIEKYNLKICRCMSCNLIS